MRSILVILSALLLVACQSNPNQSAAVAAPVAAAPSPLELADRVNDASAKRFDTVEQRITLVQEKLIALNLQLERLSRQEQQQLSVLQQMQLDSQMQTQAKMKESAQVGEPNTLDQLTELVFRLEQMSADSQSQQLEGDAQMPNYGDSDYQLASVYGPKGWIVLKYDRLSGSSWKAEAGSWKLIEEVGDLPESKYQVVLQLAPGDVKGYVAARIDSGNGITWWLKDNEWEPF
ncbi:MAG: hypothetical protein V7707_09045 [Motiliproteus sp.]